MNSAENVKEEKVIILYPMGTEQTALKPRPETFEERADKIYKQTAPAIKDNQKPLDDYETKKEVIKKQYPQLWSEYNQAKTNEDILFKRMLDELLFLGIDNTPIIRIGRAGYSTRDKILCMCVKIYYKSDLRKTQSILKELHNLSLIHKVPCFKSIDNFFNDKELLKLLDNLILISALPLAELEETGAIDSTGFSTSEFERWFSYKWGKTEGIERVWRKLMLVLDAKAIFFFQLKSQQKT